MFRRAIAINQKYTYPIVISRMDMSGECSSAIGTFVIVNSDGWLITAAHTIESITKMEREMAAVAEYEAGRSEINANVGLSRKQKQTALNQLAKPHHTATVRYSLWLGHQNWSIVEAHVNQAVDIAIAKISGFSPMHVTQYPVFKDPAKDFLPGASLCRLGFPFHQIKPVYDEPTASFVLPPGAVPLPFFPIEGILTRLVDVVSSDGQAPYPLRLIETSVAGLRGQSGGPIFDTEGALWGIQTHTQPYPLGFSPDVPGGRPGEKAHQFLNVGRGAHPESIFGLFKEHGVKFDISTH